MPRRKAAIVVAMRSGMVSLEEVRRRYELEEFLAWQRAIETRGVPARVTRLQIYRDALRSAPEAALLNVQSASWRQHRDAVGGGGSALVI